VLRNKKTEISAGLFKIHEIKVIKILRTVARIKLLRLIGMSDDGRGFLRQRAENARYAPKTT